MEKPEHVHCSRCGAVARVSTSAGGCGNCDCSIHESRHQLPCSPGMPPIPLTTEQVDRLVRYQLSNALGEGCPSKDQRVSSLLEGVPIASFSCVASSSDWDGPWARACFFNLPLELVSIPLSPSARSCSVVRGSAIRPSCSRVGGLLLRSTKGLGLAVQTEHLVMIEVADGELRLPYASVPAPGDSSFIC